jgi:hypothetical protein
LFVTVLVDPADGTLESYTHVFPTATGNGSDAADTTPTTPPEPGVALEVAAWPGAVVDETAPDVAAPDVAADVPQPARTSPATVARATVAGPDRVCLFIYVPRSAEEEPTTRSVAASVWLLERAQDPVVRNHRRGVDRTGGGRARLRIADFFTSVRNAGTDTAPQPSSRPDQEIPDISAGKYNRCLLRAVLNVRFALRRTEA